MKLQPPVVTIVQERRQGERRRRGRPSVGEDGAAQLHLMVANDDYDAACKLAKLDRVELNDWVRAAIREKRVRDELAKRGEN